VLVKVYSLFVKIDKNYVL